MKELTHISLFSGIGGLDLAAEAAGFTTKAQVEINPFVTTSSNFDSRKPSNSPISEKLGGGDLLKVCGGESPTVLSGGFPCQPISTAGNRRGKEDERWMWPDYFRVIRETLPDWIVIENSYRLLLIPECKELQADLESLNYEIRAFRIPAAGVGAPHVRERAFIIAHSRNKSNIQTNPASHTFGESGKARDNALCCTIGRKNNPPTSAGKPTDANMRNRKNPQTVTVRKSRRFAKRPRVRWRNRKPHPLPNWETYPPRICRMDDGISRKLDKPRLQALGNAVVPAVVYPIFEAIARIEKRGK